MRLRLLSMLGFLVSATGLVGCGKAADRLQPLSDEEADKYEAPRADGTCHARESVLKWSTSTSESGLRWRENLRLGLDPCGNAVVIHSGEHGSPFISGHRYLRDGQMDDNFLLPLWSDIEHFGFDIDKFGNVIVISESSLQVVTPAGRMHAGIPERGVHLTGDVVLAGPDDTWYVRGRWEGLFLLPSGDSLSSNVWGGLKSNDQRTNAILVSGDSLLYTNLYNTPSFSSSPGPYPSLDVFQVSVYDLDGEWGHLLNVSLSEDDPTWYVETGLVAVHDARRYLGTTAYTADPITHIRISCRESMLVNVDDNAWKADPLDFCGALEALELGDDGSLYSLWTVPVETLDAAVHPFEAEATLVRHDPNGAETGRWVLTDTFGRLAQDGSGAMDMKLVDGGKGAIIGALVGGPWNGRFFTSPSNLVVARVPLE